MRLTEEHVTRKLSHALVKEGYQIVSIHPPDGQGPFVIRKPPIKDAIERSSYHPDIVAISTENKPKLLIAESKLNESDLGIDLAKLAEFSQSRFAMLFSFFRCQKFDGGSKFGFDFDEIKNLDTADLPIEFVLACSTEKKSEIEIFEINGFHTRLFRFNRNELGI